MFSQCLWFEASDFAGGVMSFWTYSNLRESKVNVTGPCKHLNSFRKLHGKLR